VGYEAGRAGRAGRAGSLRLSGSPGGEMRANEKAGVSAISQRVCLSLRNFDEC
jgi:hypothetical protein